MADIFDYIYWRGDLTFSKAPFCEVDGVILARLSYQLFEKILEKGEKITVKAAAKRILSLPDLENIIRVKNDVRFLEELAKSKRFSGLKLSDFVSRTDKETQTQFSAITAEITKDLRFIAFRGTDNTIIGWKEDFNMGVMMPVPSQLEAVEYVNTVMRWKRGKLRLGGHSKGGNLAIYAAVFAKPSIQRKVVKVYNNDGPGFTKEMIESEAYRKMLPQIQTIVPQHSLVGMLLWQEEEYLVVCSSQTGIMQHDAMSWQVEGKCFVTCPSLSANSKNFHEAITSWLEGLSAKEREKFVDTLFELITASGAKTLSDINADILRSANATIKMFGTLDAGTKGLLLKILKALSTEIKRARKSKNR